MLNEYRVEIVTVGDDATLAAMRLLWTELKQTVEPSSATVLAALLAQRERFAGCRVGLVLSGGNVDLDAIPFVPR
jgi:threonine dehydratase